MTEKGVPFSHPARGSGSEQDPTHSLSREDLMEATFLPVERYGKHLAPVQLQLVQLVYSLRLISHWCLGQPFQGSRPED